jgi:hypothetical protein
MSTSHTTTNISTLKTMPKLAPSLQVSPMAKRTRKQRFKLETIEGQQGGHKPPSLPQLLPTPPLSPDPPSQLCMEPLSSSSRLASTQPHRHHFWQCTAADFAIIAAIFTASSSTTEHKILLPIRSTAVVTGPAYQPEPRDLQVL